MKSKVALTITASAVAMLVAACGGGGGSEDTSQNNNTTPPVASLQVAGTAATGAALAGASVQVKCAAGTASTTTAANGTYSVTITEGALPCMVEVTKTDNGTTVSLHSIVEAGTQNATDKRTSALANVTPVTEMIVAQLGASMPEDSFKGFKGDAVTTEQIRAAATRILAALKDAGIDLGTIDPLKAQLVAASSSGKGNAYDQLLDALAAKVGRDALKVVINQIALANSDDGLKQAMEAVSGGSLAGCPVAVSGRYRTIDLNGNVRTRTLDFKNLKLSTAGSTDVFTITPDTARACLFTATGTSAGSPVEMKFAIGPSGVGNFRAHTAGTTNPGTVGYLFPVQSHSYSALRGTWTTLQTGVAPSREHFAGQTTFGEERKLTSCEYDDSWKCVADTVVQTAVERSDGGVDVQIPQGTAATVYAYRAPNGSFALFGATNSALLPPNVIVATKPERLVPPTVGAVTSSWSVSITVSGQNVFGADPSASTYTVTAVDANTGVVTRQRTDGRIETLRLNQPLSGVRTRDAGPTFAKLYQFPLTGMGTTASINALPYDPASTAFIYDISVANPKP